jgi:hypothetical protein
VIAAKSEDESRFMVTPTPPVTGVTVIVPTRNRADLAELTVRSLATQETAVPVTVLVSDNSTDEAEVARLRDAVAAWPQRTAAPRVLVIRPGADLPMGVHWEWARKRACEVPGTSHVLYVTDRTMVKPGALDTLVTLASCHPDRAISFTNDQVDDSAEPIRLVREPWTGRVCRVAAGRLLDLSAEMIVARPLPRALNTLIPVTVLDAIEERYKGVFESTAPDFCFCYRLLQSGEDVIYLDRALTVMHGLQRSNGNSTTRGVASADTTDFIKHASAGGGIASATPLPQVTTTYNVITHEYVSARESSGGSSGRPLNRRAYVRTLARETDGFVPGPMRDANERVLKQERVGFGRLARLTRTIGHYGHFLRVLGPRDFVFQAVDRSRGPAVEVFETKEQALEAALTVEAPRRAGAWRLRYLKGDLLRH